MICDYTWCSTVRSEGRELKKKMVNLVVKSFQGFFEKMLNYKSRRRRHKVHLFENCGVFSCLFSLIHLRNNFILYYIHSVVPRLKVFCPNLVERVLIWGAQIRRGDESGSSYATASSIAWLLRCYCTLLIRFYLGSFGRSRNWDNKSRRPNSICWHCCV